MIIVGLPNCSLCKICREIYPSYSYVELTKSFTSHSDPRAGKIKRALIRLNKTGSLPVILNDTYTSIITTIAIKKMVEKIYKLNKLKKQVNK
jgi:hypothetical protein